MKIFSTLLFFLLIASVTNLFGQTITISEARSASAGSSVTVTGIITNGGELGTIRYLQDATAGIAAYSYDMLKDVVPGDSVTITGTLKDYSGLLELDPVTNVTVHAHDKELPAPVLLTPSQLDEAYEGILVTINDAVFKDAGSEFTSGINYDFTASGQSAEIRISSSESPFISKVVPSYPVIITGILSEYSGTYQILVRGLGDILSTNSVNLNSVPQLSDLTTNGFTIYWETDSVSTTQAYYGHTPELELGLLSGPDDTTKHTIAISGADPSTLFYVQPFSVRKEDTAKAAVLTYITQSESSGKMTCYFNLPVDNSVSDGVNAIMLDNTIDDTLIAYINRAKYSIDMAIYHYDLYNIADISTALNNAYKRGVTVRVVYQASDEGEDAYIVNEDIGLLDSGIGKIESKTGTDYGIMHNKFLVFDVNSSDPNDAIVWTGSTNFTDNQLNYDANNVIIIQDKSLAVAYTLEFNEMFGSDGTMPDAGLARFGPDKTDNTPHEFIIDGKRVESYFSPSDGVSKHILKEINSSDSDLEVACMLITRSELGRAIAAQSVSGVESKVLEDTYDKWNQYVADIIIDELDEAFKTNGEGGTMHNKYMIVDQSNYSSDPVVLTGSHNWTSAAENTNDENTLIVHDSVMANLYYQDFNARFNNGTYVSDAPVCVNDFLTMTHGSSITYDVLYNDERPGPVTISILEDPKHGNVVVNQDQTLTYTPDDGFNGKIDTLAYKVCLVSNNQICSNALMIVYVNKPVSSVDKTEMANIALYPLPAKEQLIIDAGNTELTSMEMFDISGKQVIKQSFSSAVNKSLYRIDVSALNNGMYYLKLTDRDGNMDTRKVIVSNR
jgi:phosphatidylserine/phosphatidylglycerophosphate/cardiolipin synthase-like enzyme/DNA/RNA endonuclease YhcR with UshA esterase domain